MKLYLELGIELLMDKSVIYCTVLYSALLCSTLLYTMVVYCFIWYYIVLWYCTVDRAKDEAIDRYG